MSRRRSVTPGDPTRPVVTPRPPAYTGPKLTKDDDGKTTHPNVTRRVTPQEKKDFSIRYADGKAPFKYGRHRLAGKILYTFNYQVANEFWYVLGFCRGEVDSLVQLIHNGTELGPGWLNTAGWDIWFYTGTETQGVDPNLSTGFIDPSWNEALPGICYAVVRLKGVSYNWPKLPDLLFEIKTKKALDSRTGTYVYSENPVVQFHDWLRHPEGKALRASRVNKTKFDAAANIGDELVSGNPRFACHPSIDAVDTSDVEKMFALMCNGRFFFSQNQWNLVLDRPAASVATYTDAHFLKDPAPEGWREDPDERINEVVIEHTDRANGWKVVARPPVKSAALQAGREPARRATYRMEWLHDPSVVARMETYLLNSHLYDFKLRLAHNAKTADRQVGDVITQSVASRGIGAQLFTIVSREKNTRNNTFVDTLLEYNADKYSNAVASGTSKIKSTLPDPMAPPPAPTALVLKRERWMQNEWRITISWTPSVWGFPLRYIVTAQLPGSSEWVVDEVSAGPVFFDIDDVTKIYTIRVYAVVDSTGVKSTTALTGTSSLTDATTAQLERSGTTTNAVATNLEVIAINSARTYWIETVVRARRTGGTAGAADDGAVFIVKQAFETISGTITPIGDATYEIFRDQESWTADLVISGSNVIVQVTGAANNTIAWASSTTVMSIATQQTYAFAAMAAATWITGDHQLEARDADAITDNAQVVICDTITMLPGRTYLIESRILARRQSGDSAVYVLREAYRTLGGVITRIADPASDTHESEDWSASLVPSGANLLVVVKGAASQTVLWHATTTVQSISSTPPALYAGADLYDSPRESGVTTTDATSTALDTINIVSGKTHLIDARVVGRRSGGSSGSSEDAAAMVVHRAYKTVSGIVTQIGDPIEHRMRDDLPWDVDLVISGSNVVLKVTGAANNNIAWYSATTVRVVA